MLRKGEVRLNGGRTRQDVKIATGDNIRIPPIRITETKNGKAPAYLVEKVRNSIIYEDNNYLAINKPAGISVHSGSRDPYGVIEALRQHVPQHPNIQLAHRIDRMTSGCLLFCKSRDVLRQVHAALKNGEVKKTYLALLRGKPDQSDFEVDASLTSGNLHSGERMVNVDHEGKKAVTIFHCQQRYKTSSLYEVELLTGRTHQIRVHASHIGHPLAMDIKYGDANYNKQMKQFGLKRMFLHASRLEFQLESMREKISIQADLPDDLSQFLKTEYI